MIRYEDLTGENNKEIVNALNFIGVNFNEINTLQTIDGIKTSRNSRFSGEEKSQMKLSSKEKVRLFFMGCPVWHHYKELPHMAINGFSYYYIILMLYIKSLIGKTSRMASRILS